MTDRKCIFWYLVSVSCCMLEFEGQSFLVSIMSDGKGVSLGIMLTPFFYQFVCYRFCVMLLLYGGSLMVVFSFYSKVPTSFPK